MSRQLDNTIQTEIQSLADRYSRERLRGLARLITERVRRQQQQPPTDDRFIYLLTDHANNRAGEPLVGNLTRLPKPEQITFHADARSKQQNWGEFELNVGAESHLARAQFIRLPGGRYALLVGRDINQLTALKQRILQVLTWGLGMMLLLAGAGGWLFGRRTVRKIERINQTTRSIMSGDLSRRVPLTGHNDDFDQVAQNLNLMLDRIQTLMEDIRRVSDSIAHDLRTPLARLRQNLEDARKRNSLDAPTATSLEESIKEADSLLSTFNALLRIARIEAEHSQAGFAEIELRPLMRDVIEFYEPLCEEKHQHIHADLAPNIRAVVDRDLMFQAVANLIENAIKYSPPHGVIHIALEGTAANVADNDVDNNDVKTKTTTAGKTSNANVDVDVDAHRDPIIIRVADNGIGIPDGERKNVFRRFYRLDQSRSTIGNGLGLSMVAAVIALHNGDIELLDNAPGLCAVITLPA